MGDSGVGLLGPAQVALWDEDVTHGQHAQAAKFFRRVENHWRESRRHFRVKTDLDAGLNFVFAFYEQIQKFLSVHNRFTEVSHETDQRRVPFVDDLRKRRRSRSHENLANSVVELVERFIVDAQEALGSSLLRHFVL